MDRCLFSDVYISILLLYSIYIAQTVCAALYGRIEAVQLQYKSIQESSEGLARGSLQSKCVGLQNKILLV